MPLTAQVCGDRLGLRAVQIGGDHARALIGQAANDAFAKALRAAGDDDALSLDPSHGRTSNS